MTVRAQCFARVEAAVSRRLADARGCAEAAEEVVQAPAAGPGWPPVEMWLVDEARRVLVCAAWFTTREATDSCFPELEYGVGLPGAVVASERAPWIPDLAADTASLRSRLATHYGLQAAVGTPITSGGTVLGALALYGDHVEDPEGSLTALILTMDSTDGHLDTIYHVAWKKC